MKPSQFIQRIPASATIEMAQKSRELQNKGFDVISLTLGEPDFDTPQHIKEAAKKALDEGFTKYSPVPGLLSFRKAICEKFKRDNNLDFTPEQIVVSTGAKQTIANIFLCTLNPGDEVVLPAPFWVSYAGLADMCQAKQVIIKTNIDTDFKINAKQLEDALTEKSRILIFSSPCNPTGSLYSKEELESLANVIEKYPDLLVVSDEIYEFNNFTGNPHFSIGSIESIKDRVVTVNGMSKGFAMTGWRIGYMGAPLWLAKACDKLQGQFTSGASTMAQKAAEFALQSDYSETFKMRDEFKKRRDMMLGLLGEIKGLKLNIPEGAFYIFADVSAFFGKKFGDREMKVPNDVVMYLLETEYVGTVGGEDFGDDNCLRLSYAASEEQLREAAARMKRALDKLA
jgi:aspartate aminotransferase